MAATLDDYLPHIGQVTIAAAALEEVAIHWGAFLTPGDAQEVHAKQLLRGLDSNLDYLIDQVKTRVSAKAAQKKVLKLIEKARALKNRRNEVVHGVWADLVHADSGKPAGVGRSRYEKNKATKKLRWDLSTPSVAEVKKLAKELGKVTEDLNTMLGHLWDLDPDIAAWRTTEGF